jgi:hypothetical protein
MRKRLNTPSPKNLAATIAMINPTIAAVIKFKGLLRRATRTVNRIATNM